MFDLRLPSGIFFAAIGFLLVVMGITMSGLRAPMTTANVDLYAGLVILLFGIFLLLMARRARNK
jgi:uncharacterized membrane protein